MTVVNTFETSFTSYLFRNIKCPVLNSPSEITHLVFTHHCCFDVVVL